MLGITNVSNAPSIVLRGKIVSSWSNLPTTSGSTDYDMYQQGYTYYASISEAGTMENSIAEVTFSDTDAKSGNYAPICRTYAGEIRVYSKTNAPITIPLIVIHSTVETYNYTLDSGPVEGSTKAVMSGGVYSALANSDIVNVATGIRYIRNGNIIHLEWYNISIPSGMSKLAEGLIPKSVMFATGVIATSSLIVGGYCQIDRGKKTIEVYANNTYTHTYGSLIYITDE